ncbi:MAG: ATP-binding cassette domain-containing protein [Deltaproteobacteria bacterium]|nr:ATP-binding cassette domain-containing protein [Deltaproteobacteria bacterium]
MISIENVIKTFGPVRALDGISFEMQKGEVVGFLGPNGAGKTTAMRILTGFLSATSGSCRIAGLDVATQSLEARRKIGYLPESAALYGDMEVTEYLAYLGTLRRLDKISIHRRIKEVVKTCGLEKALGRKMGVLSKGYRQRAGLAQALLHNPDILILDEPTVGLDPNQIVEIRQLIQEIGKQKTILLSTHILPEVDQTCKRVIIISEGKIVGQGSPHELVHQTRGASIYHAGIRGARAEIEQGLRTLPDFQSVEFTAAQDGISHVRIAIDSKENLSEEIFKLAVAKKWSLTELRREKVTLEDVFQKLTQ